jgi:hypothetical protein
MGGCRRMVSYGEATHIHSTSSTPLDPTSKHCASPLGDGPCMQAYAATVHIAALCTTSASTTRSDSTPYQAAHCVLLAALKR